VPVAAFSVFLLGQFGIPWPAGWANVAGPQYVLPNALVVWRQVLPHYAAVAGLPAPAVSGPALATAAGALCVVGLIRLWRAWPALRFVPVALALNLGVIFSSPTYLTPDLFSPATFFRHLSVLLPWLVPPLALLLSGRGGSGQQEPFGREPAADGGRRTLRCAPSPAALGQAADGGPGEGTLRRDRGGPQSSVLGPLPRPAAGRGTGPTVIWPVLRAVPWAAAVALLVWELAVLGASTARDQAARPTILTSDPYVLGTDLWRAPDQLPELPFTRRSGSAPGPPAVDPAFDYLAFRRGLFAAVGPYDLHVNDAGRAYVLAAGVFALAGLAALLVADRPTRPRQPAPERVEGSG
jgi:hypothetical protein